VSEPARSHWVRMIEALKREGYDAAALIAKHESEVEPVPHRR